MVCYRICSSKYAQTLKTTSQLSARWNYEGFSVLYTAGTLALACLENLAHKSGASLIAGDFSAAFIDIDSASIREVSLEKLESLDKSWRLVENYFITQEIGNYWLDSKNSLILKVPSAIIPFEFNYLINPNHPDYEKVRIVEVFPFLFDPRLKGSI